MHNHPSGDSTPSQVDIAMTKEIVSVAQPLDISVHDHIIVGRDGYARSRGLPPRSPDITPIPQASPLFPFVCLARW
jgi:hypothetical protein